MPRAIFEIFRAGKHNGVNSRRLWIRRIKANCHQLPQKRKIRPAGYRTPERQSSPVWRG